MLELDVQDRKMSGPEMQQDWKTRDRKMQDNDHGLALSSVMHGAPQERSCSTLSPVSTGMGYRHRAGIPPRYVTKPAR